MKEFNGNICVYTRIYKLNRLCDSKRATFSNTDEAMEFIDKLSSNPNYRRDGFTYEGANEHHPERYFVTYRRVA
ncbi:hypothetical protein VMY22_2 [Bacillus phage VMY22]|uniref:Uncharacterized protein n=1 Tax=Bacillus phage VMY22 TaxID=1734382 RepID=A0A0N9ST24_9CAUD|nr:hypothetical protein VMY22_2 [Bacillus phage VMY22]ALH46467.1 hypothetical protein VMY22_2 [Bacillus phage VMY22]